MSLMDSAAPRLAPTGRRWFVVALVSLLLNAVATAWLSWPVMRHAMTRPSGPLPPTPEGGLCVAAFSPERGRPVAITGEIRFRFSEDVEVASGRDHESSAGARRPGGGPRSAAGAARSNEQVPQGAAPAAPSNAALVQIEPPTEGRTRWIGTRTLAFEPTLPWKRATAFTATLTTAFEKAAGRALEGPRSFAFSTTPVALSRVRQIGFTPDQSAVFELEFDDVVDPMEVEKRLTILDPLQNRVLFETVDGATGAEGETAGARSEGTGPAGAAGAARPSGGPRSSAGALRSDWTAEDPSRRERSRTIAVRTGPLTADRLAFEIAPGLMGSEGDLATSETITEFAEVSFRLRLAEVRAGWNPRGDSTIRADFNSSMDPEHLLPFVLLDPPVPCRAESAHCGVLLRGPFQAGSRYRITFLKGLRSADGHLLTANVSRTVQFEDALPELSIVAGGEVLSPASDLLLPVETVNLREFRVSIDRVYPNNRIAFLRARHSWSLPSDLSERLVTDRRIAVEAPRNRAHTTDLDLRALLGSEARGTLWVEVNGADWREDAQIVTITDLGVVAKQSARDFLVWVNSFRTLDPVAGATVEVYSRTNQCLLKGETEADGLARFADCAWHDDRTPFAVIVTKGDETAALQIESNRVSTEPFEVTGRPWPGRGYEAWVYGDRSAYRPGETVHLVAVVRDANLAPPEPFPVEFVLERPDGRAFRKAGARLSRFGTAEVSCEIPVCAPTGTWTARVRLPGAESNLGQTRFLLEEFVPPQMQVGITVCGEDPEAPLARRGPGERLKGTEPIAFEVAARYLFGAPAADVRVEGGVTFTPEEFGPAAWPEFQFGDSDREFRREVRHARETRADSAGRASLEVTPASEWRPASALRATLHATAHDPGGRPVSAYTCRSLDVYSAYVGLRAAAGSESPRVGMPARFEIVSVDPEGRLTARAAVEVTLFHEVWTWCLRSTSGGRYEYGSKRELTEVRRERVTLTAGRGVFEFAPGESRQMRLRVADPESGAATAISFWVSGGAMDWNPWSMEKPDRIDLTFDRQQVQPGGAARMLVKAPFSGRALLTIESDRLLESRIVVLDSNTAELDVSAPPGQLSNLYCSVTLLRAVTPEEVWRPHRAFGVASLPIDPAARRIEVSIEAPAEIRPASRLVVPVSVRDTTGGAVAAEITLSAVDEGICMLTGLASPDPLAFFWGRRALGVATADLYGRLMPEREKPSAGSPSSQGGDEDAQREGIRIDPARLNPVPARRFRPVALWSGRVETDAAGRAEFTLDIPEFNGRLRLSAVAVSADRFGSARRDLLVRVPLIVRSSLPRVLAPGDTFTVPIEVFNRGTKSGVPEIGITVEGVLEVIEPPSAIGELAAGASGRSTATLRAIHEAGTAVVTVRGRLDGETREERTEIAIRPAAPRITLGGCGSVPAGETARLALPAGWLRGTGRREVTGTSNPAAMLGGGLDYLVHYPYGCIEQTVSGAFPLLYLHDLETPERIEGRGPLDVGPRVSAGIDRVLSMQTGGGGFSMWPGGRGDYTWGTFYASHFLVEARAAGFDVPEQSLDSALSVIERTIDSNLRQSNDERDALSLRAYGSLILALRGRPKFAWMEYLRDRRAELDAESTALLAAAYAATGRPGEAGEVLEGTTASTWHGQSEGDRATRPGARDGLLHSSTRSNALLLSAWVSVDPSSPMVSELVRRIESTRRNGRWATTQENAFAVLALGKLARAVVRERPGFTTEVRNAGGTLAQVPSSTPLDILLHDDAGAVIELSPTGTGTLYYSWTAQGVPADGRVPLEDHGLRVRRAFLDRSGRPVDLAQVHRGDAIVIEITTGADQETPNVAIENLLPAGFEVENPRLGTGARDESEPRPGETPVLIPDHVELRDDRVLVFATIPHGHRVHRTLVRAVTAGHFALPPVCAEAMYDPDRWSRSGSGEVVIVE